MSFMRPTKSQLLRQEQKKKEEEEKALKASLKAANKKPFGANSQLSSSSKNQPSLRQRPDKLNTQRDVASKGKLDLVDSVIEQASKMDNEKDNKTVSSLQLTLGPTPVQQQSESSRFQTPTVSRKLQGSIGGSSASSGSHQYLSARRDKGKTPDKNLEAERRLKDSLAKIKMRASIKSQGQKVANTPSAQSSRDSFRTADIDNDSQFKPVAKRVSKAQIASPEQQQNDKSNGSQSVSFNPGQHYDIITVGALNSIEEGKEGEEDKYIDSLAEKIYKRQKQLSIKIEDGAVEQPNSTTQKTSKSFDLGEVDPNNTATKRQVQSGITGPIVVDDLSSAEDLKEQNQFEQTFEGSLNNAKQHQGKVTNDLFGLKSENSSNSSGNVSVDSFATAKAKDTGKKKLRRAQGKRQQSITALSRQSNEMNRTANFDIDSQDKKAYFGSFAETPHEGNDSIEEKTEIDAEIDLLSESDVAPVISEARATMDQVQGEQRKTPRRTNEQQKPFSFSFQVNGSPEKAIQTNVENEQADFHGTESLPPVTRYTSSADSNEKENEDRLYTIIEEPQGMTTDRSTISNFKLRDSDMNQRSSNAPIRPQVDPFEMKQRDHRQSIVDNGELFNYLQNQYSGQNQTNAQVNVEYFQNQPDIETKHKVSLEEKIRMRKSVIAQQPGQIRHRKTLKDMDISDLGDHAQDVQSPCFKQFQPVDTNKFRFDFDFEQEDDLDRQVRNHKMDISSNIDDRSEDISGNFIEQNLKKVERQWHDAKKKRNQNSDKKKERSKTPQPLEIIEIEPIEKNNGSDNGSSSPRFQQFDLYQSVSYKNKTPKAESRKITGGIRGLEKVFSPKKIGQHNERKSVDLQDANQMSSGKKISIEPTSPIPISRVAKIQTAEQSRRKQAYTGTPSQSNNLLRTENSGSGFQPPSTGQKNVDINAFDDGKSQHSRISKVSRFTQNLLNKSHNGVNDQWYQFIYNNNDILNDSLSDISKQDIKSQNSRFTLRSKISRRSNLSNLYNYNQPKKTSTSASFVAPDRHSNLVQGRKVQATKKGPYERLNELIDGINVFRFIRILWLLNPIINSRSIKTRLFNFNHHQVQDLGRRLTNPVRKAIFLYLSDDLLGCLNLCQQNRQIYIFQRASKQKDTQLVSYDMVKIYVTELACLIELIRQDNHTQDQVKQYRRKAHQVLEEIPILVKNREQHQFTIIELLVGFKESRAQAKLKDLDFISFKLFRLERAIMRERGSSLDISMNTPDDDDDKMAPDQYAKEIQRQFSKVAQNQYIKKIEYFIYGALCAFKNHHYLEASNFISQAPFVCNFGEQLPDIDTLIVFEMLKMTEVKLLTKIGRPEQAVIQLCNRYFLHKIIDDEHYDQMFPYSAKQQNAVSFETAMFIDQSWCLYKEIKYLSRLIEFRQDHFKFKITSQLSKDSRFDQKMLKKANNDQCNQMYRLNFIVDAINQYQARTNQPNRILFFQWLLVKIFLKLTKTNKAQHMISNENFSQIFGKIDILRHIRELYQFQSGTSKDSAFLLLPQLTKTKNRKIVEDYMAKYNGRNLAFERPTISHGSYSSIYDAYGARSSLNGRRLGPSASWRNSGRVSNELNFDQEKQFARNVMSSHSFYIMLSHLLDFVDHKVRMINQRVFHEIGPRQAIKALKQQALGMSPQYEAGASGDSITFQNYFDLLQTDTYTKQVKNLKLSLKHFLGSVTMIVFQNLCLVNEITQHALLSSGAYTEPFRGIETIYINETLLRAEERSRLGPIEDRSAISGIDHITELGFGFVDPRQNAGPPLTTTNQRASDNLKYRAARPLAETPGLLLGGQEGRLRHRSGSLAGQDRDLRPSLVSRGLSQVIAADALGGNSSQAGSNYEGGDGEDPGIAPERGRSNNLQGEGNQRTRDRSRRNDKSRYRILKIEYFNAQEEDKNMVDEGPYSIAHRDELNGYGEIAREVQIGGNCQEEKYPLRLPQQHQRADDLFVRSPRNTQLDFSNLNNPADRSHDESLPSKYEPDDQLGPTLQTQGRLTMPSQLGISLFREESKQESGGSEVFGDLQMRPEGRVSVDFYGELNLDGLNESNIDFERASSLLQRPSHVNGQSIHGEMNGDDSENGVARGEEGNESEADDDDENISIQNLIQTEQERLNFDMINQTLYCEHHLHKLALACCIADCHHKLAIRIISVLMKVRSQQKALKVQSETYMNFLEILMAYNYLRLNYLSFQQNQNLSTSRIQDSRMTGNMQSVDNLTTGGAAEQSIFSNNLPDASQHNVSGTVRSQLKHQILANLQNQDYFLQQALKYFTEFDCEKHFKKQMKLIEDDHLIVMMFIHVQNELEKYKVLKKAQINKVYQVKQHKRRPNHFRLVVYGTTQSPEKVKKEQKQQFMDLVQFQISSQKKKGLSHSIIEEPGGQAVSPPEGQKTNIFKQSMVVPSSAAPGSGSAKQRFMDKFVTGRQSHKQSFVSSEHSKDLGTGGTAKFPRATADFGLTSRLNMQNEEDDEFHEFINVDSAEKLRLDKENKQDQ